MTPLLAAVTAAPFPLLPWLVAVPAVGAFIVAVMPRSRPELSKPLAVTFSLVAFAIGVYILVKFQINAEFQFVSRRMWVEQLGMEWNAGIDGISLWLVILTVFLFPIAFLGVDPDHDPKPYYAWLLLLEAGCLGVFISLDLFMFFVFFEVVLVPMYFMIARWGHGNRDYAAMKFFLYTMFGSAFMLIGILSLAIMNARITGVITFDLITLANTQVIGQNVARWLFLSFAVAFAIKVPLFPFHTWLPDAHTEAPTAGSVLLAGVMLKLGTYGFVRFGLYLFPEASRYFAPLFLTLGVIGIIYGAIVATMQTDLKRLVAYSSVAHMGFVMVGIFSITVVGLEGSLLQMVNHGISTGALFLLVGWIYERLHTREIAALSGIQRVAPMMAGVFTLVMLSSIGVPGLNGFVGEFLSLLGLFIAHRWWAVVAASGVILAALYLLWAYQRVFHGEPNEKTAKMSDLTWREGLVILPLLVLIVLFGVYPKPVLDRMEPAVDRLVAHVETTVDGFQQPDHQGTGGGTFEEIVIVEVHEGDGHSDEEGDHSDETDAEHSLAEVGGEGR